ncbi:MAG TPA: PKD domain-containing protein [Thermoanaerobaculia bacterium]|jgi:PKD repeat protein|nr:PKD domain-containing protein [Thermoanaerobaculia bacterium]
MSRLSWPCALLGALLVPALAQAASPASGTLSQSNPVVTWTGGPLVPSAAACTGPEDPACDHFALEIVPPPGPGGFTVRITLTPLDDWDLSVYDPAGSGEGTSGNPPGIAEIVVLSNPVAGVHTVSGAPFAVGAPYSATAVLESGAAPPPPPPPGTQAVKMFQYDPPAGIGTSAGEPSIGVGRLGVEHVPNAAMYIAGLEVLRITRDECLSGNRQETDAWVDKTAPNNGLATLDPILFTDFRTGRTFASQLGPKCSLMSLSDDDGESWLPSQGCGINAGVDHQTVGGGPFPASDPIGGIGYPNATYYCSQDAAIAQCALSRDGGLTFGPAVPIYNVTQCGGLHGHVKVAPDGTVYVPNKNCQGLQGVAVSTNSGLSWTVRTVPGSASGNTDPHLDIGPDNKVYFAFSAGSTFVATSTDHGQTWSAPIDLGTTFGIANSVFPEVVTGDNGRAAVAFLGTPGTGSVYGTDTTLNVEWHLYVAVTYDGGATWTTSDATPTDPVQRGAVCTQGTTCSSGRNLLDFNDIALDDEGRVLVAYADGCVGACAAGGAQSGTALARVSGQVGGKRLLAAFDNHAPGKVGVTATEIDGSVLVEWFPADDFGTAVTGYVIERSANGTTFTPVDTVSASTFRYLDSPAPPASQYVYRVHAVSGAGSGASCPAVPVEAPPTVTPADPCQVPGVQVTDDPAGDQTGAPGNGGLDLKAAFVAEPWSQADPDGDNLEIRIRTHQSLDPLPPPNGYWYVYFTYRGVKYYAAMTTGDVPATPAYEYGRIDLNPTTGINDQTSLGTIEGSVGGDTITMRLSRSLLTQPVVIGDPPQPAPVAGDVLSSAKGETRLLIGGGGTGLITVIDDSTPSDYTVHTNAACAPNGAPTARLAAAPQSGHAPLEVDFDGSDSSDPDAGDTIAEYTFDFGDGSDPVTQGSPTVSHTYTAPGNYNASLSVKDSRGKASTNTATAVIQVMPDGDFYSVTPCRLLDTRTPEDGAAPVASGTDRVLDVVAVTRCGVSPLAKAVALNVTVIQPGGSGRVTVYPANLSIPATSTLNFPADVTRANNVLMMLSPDGRIKLRPVVNNGGSTHLVVDVTGFFIEP